MFIRSPRWSWRIKFPFFLLLAGLACELWPGVLPSAYAFPELVRHGYANCISCHVSPNGSGIITEYGRQLSREVLSTWGREGEEKLAYGVLGEMPKWIDASGDLRVLRLQSDTGRSILNQTILMQADLEAALKYEQWTLVGTVGRLDTAIYPVGSDWISRRHYLMYRPSDEISVRAGRFMQQYGINMADHFTTVKEGLGFDTGTETYNIEGAWLNEKYNVYATANIGRPDDSSLQREKGASLTGSMMLGDSNKVGVSYYYGTNDLARRHLLGGWGILGISPHLFVLSELDFQRNFAYNFTDPQYGFATYHRLDYELIQGVHVFGTGEALKNDFGDERSRFLRYGLGAQFFPRPHFEIEASLQTQQRLSSSEDFNRFMWLMLHYYL